MGVFFSRAQTTNPGPREPDLGMDSIEIDDSDLTTSYMEVNFPLKIRMEPASPGSSWINLVFDEIGANNNKPSSDKESSTAAVRQGIYSRSGSVTPISRVRPPSTSELTLQLPTVSSTLSTPESQRILQTLLLEEKQYRGAVVVDVLQEHASELVAAINPSEAACRLYGFGIINEGQRNSATLEAVSREQRSMDLITILIRELKDNFHWFDDACKALENSGAQNIVEHLQASVKEMWSKYSPDLNDEPKSKHGDDVGKSDSDDKHISNSDVDEDRHHIDILPSAPLSQLDLAYKSGGEDAARQLLQSQPIEQNNELLHDACKEGIDLSFLEVLLSISSSLCDVNGRDKHGRTGLHTACASSSKRKGNEQKIKVCKLLESGADSRIRDEDGNTPLHIAVNAGNTEISRLLLKHTPDLINIQNNERRTPLHVSTMNHPPSVTAELVKIKFCNLCLRDKDEKTPLHYAAMSGSAELVKILLTKGRSGDFIDAIDGCGDTALHMATREGHTGVMKLLLKFNTNASLKNNEGQTALDIAEDKGNFKAIKVLLKKKYPVSWRFKLQKMNVKRSTSVARLPNSASNMSLKSANSEAASSVCSDINITSAEIDIDNDKMEEEN